jgi:predicted flap endonuclease-1-like 5' DNA nuclease
MGLIERIKSVLGFGTSATPSQPATGRDRPSPDETGTSDPQPASESEDDEQRVSTEAVGEPGDDVDVTVEHDPDDGAEQDESSATGAAEPDTETEEAVKGAETETGTGTGTDADLEEIKGIGPAYADRLREAGVENVADLATADAAEVSDASGIGQSRVQKWIDRAETY